MNTSGEDILLKNGEKIGCLNEVAECEDVEGQNFCVSETKDGETRQCLNVGNLMNNEQKEKFDKIIDTYDECMRNTPVNIPCKIPILHRIDLVDDSPISLPPRRIPYNKRQEVEEKINELIENDFVEPSTSAYSTPLVPVIKRDRLKKVEDDNVRLATLRNTNVSIKTPLDTQQDPFCSSDSDDEFDDNQDEPYRNRLRQRPCVGPNRYFTFSSVHVDLL